LDTIVSDASDEHQDDAKRANEVIDLTSPPPEKSSRNKSYVSSMLGEWKIISLIPGENSEQSMVALPKTIKQN